MECRSEKHGADIHDCVEKIINGYRHDMNKHVPHKYHSPHIMVTCAQVDVILAYASSEAAFHRKDHVVAWESVVYQHKHDLACEKCGNFFTNMVIEKARELRIL